MAQSFATASNVFVPGYSAELTTRLNVEYVRNWKEFPFLMMSSRTTIPTPSFLYKRTDPAAQGRVLSNPQAYEFPDGQERPNNGQENQSVHDFVQVNAKRYSFSYYVGDLTQEFSADDEVQRAINNLGGVAATSMADVWYTALAASGNHLSTHVDTATNWGGGLWGSATSANRYIQKSLMAIRKIIRKDTLNGVGADDLILLVGPDVADGMSRSQEIADTLIRTDSYKDYLQFEMFRNQLDTYGLPPKLYGYTLIVDDFVKETARPLATASKSFFAGSNTAYVVTKADALKGQNGNTSFSSMHIFEPKGHDLKVEVFDEPWNRRKRVTAETFFDVGVVGREASAVITSVLS